MAVLVVLVMVVLTFPEQTAEFSILALSLAGIYAGYEQYSAHSKQWARQNGLETQQKR